MKESINFVGTRGDEKKGVNIPFSSAILSPGASYGGLYAPEKLPNLGIGFLNAYKDSSYKLLACKIFKSIGVDISLSDLRDALSKYSLFDDPKNPVPVVKVGDTYVSELWHGPTRAFKDKALQPFPVLVSKLAQELDKQYLVLAATSGDTGPAALHGFRNLPNTKVVCLYPDGGTSDVQRLQMVTEDAENLKVIGINGNFDDAQKALKKMIKSTKFKSELRKKGYELSAANSVNFGRIIFQIVYHFWSYFELVRQGQIVIGDKVNLVIPSGNFGNGLAAYYAKKMGLPVNKIILASNENNVLTEFVNKGVYDLRSRKLHKTSSPAMDILISSNIERLLLDLYGSIRTRELMESLEEIDLFVLDSDELWLLQDEFEASYASDKDVDNIIKYVFNTYNYVADPHTATAFATRFKYIDDKDNAYMIYATAEWTKFSKTMARVFGCEDDLEIIAKKLGVNLSPEISKLKDMPIIHDEVIEKEDISSKVLAFV